MVPRVTVVGVTAAADLRAGHAALARGEWQAAADAFGTLLRGAELGPALEGLATARWWLDDGPGTIAARERAFRHYRRERDTLGAARVATALAWDSLLFGGRPAVARGWLDRAERLLEMVEPAPEHGWLSVRKAEFALRVEANPTVAREHAIDAAERGRALGVDELEVVGLALEGLAQVNGGEVADGMRRLDEAVASVTSGEFSDLMWMGKVCCFLIYACEGVRDYDRATQWCDQVTEFCARWNLRPLFAVCRTQYASVLIARGTWAAAESELDDALRALSPDSTREVHTESLARLGELRRRQGRAREAERLFALAPRHTLSQLGLAALALERGQAATALEIVGALLRRLPPTNLLGRVAALELVVRGHAALADSEAAEAAAADLRQIADAAGTDSLRGAAIAAEGVARAISDPVSGAAALETAVEIFEGLSPYEAARSRLEHARLLSAAGEGVRAQAEARLAATAFHVLGASAAAEAARSLAADREGIDGLTRRELEVLGLLAAGLTNRDIAARLVLSEHTVHRHVANILRKLQLASRAAAAAYAVRGGLT